MIIKTLNAQKRNEKNLFGQKSIMTCFALASFIWSLLSSNWNFYKDQACNRPRNCWLSTSWGAILGSHWTCFCIAAIWYREIQGRASIMPRGVRLWDSDTNKFESERLSLSWIRIADCWIWRWFSLFVYFLFAILRWREVTTITLLHTDKLLLLLLCY